MRNSDSTPVIVLIVFALLYLWNSSPADFKNRFLESWNQGAKELDSGKLLDQPYDNRYPATMSGTYTDKTTDKSVLSLYEKRLSSDGWELVEKKNNSITFSKGDKKFNIVVISSGGNSTTYKITLD